MFLADRYEILEQIGTGGMSDVYKAKCHKLNRYVAIKVLKKEYSEDKTFVSKFRIEAQSAAGLAHPNIVNVYDVGDENGLYYIVMELVEGITLKQYIEKKVRLPYKEAISIAIQVARGMDAAHKHHIIHRDIKPQNIIISKDGKVKVTDFGIAKAATSTTINSSAAMGSVHYISPEQARIGYSDERSDIYSFGITLFEMLTGNVPFDGETTVAVAVQHIQNTIPAPSTIVPGIPVGIDKIVLKCTQKKPEFRYQNADELIADLKKALVMPDQDFVVMGTGLGNEQNNSNGISDTEKNQGVSGYDSDESDDDILNEDAEDELADDMDSADETDIDDESNDKLDKTMKWIGIGIVIVIVIISIVMAVKLLGGSFGGSVKETTTAQTDNSAVTGSNSDTNAGSVTVPKVVGKTEQEAKSELNAAGLGIKSTYEYSDTVEEGKIIAQSPSADTTANKNDTVIVKISRGPENKMSTVPAVTGKSEADAKNELGNAGFNVSVDYKYSDTVEAGKVISQTPAGNTSATGGTTVTVIVSRGKQVTMSTVPSLIGDDESTAMQKIDAAGFKADVKRVSSESVTKGCVISQNQAANAQLAQGSTITIYISTGSSVTEPSSTETETTTPAAAKKNEQ